MHPLQTCFDTWKRQGKGYVFLSYKIGSSWKDKPFQWPAERENIERLFDSLSAKKAEIYWTPLMYTGDRKLKEYAKPANTLFADLDPINPDTLEIRPTIAWESSPGRYQALWWLDDKLIPADLEALNRNLSYYIGADRGGWDLAQVLRVPGTKNYKYDPPKQGKLLWASSALYNRKIFDRIPAPVVEALSTDTTLVQLLHKYRKEIPKKVSQVLQYPPSRIQEGRRSDTLWFIESELVAARIPLEDIVRIIQLSPWNKYRGRTDEWKRITTEVTKVYNSNQGSALEEAEEEDTKLPWVGFSGLMSNMGLQPGWLIRDIWLKRSHGIVAGEPKTFKSTVALDIAVSVASGVPLWNNYPVEETGPVLIIQNENSDWIIRDRMEKILNSKNLIGKVSGGPKVFDISFPNDYPIYFLNNYGYSFTDPLHRQELEAMIQEIKPILIVFDPLYLMFDGEINSAKDLQPILFWLLGLKNTYKTAVMVIHHWNKSGSSSRGGQRMLGSTTLHGWTESALYIQTKEEDSLTDNGESKVEIEREYRAAGVFSKLTLNIKMGQFGDPSYRINMEETAKGSDPGALMDLLSVYPQGLTIRAAAKELDASRRKITQLVERTNGKAVMVKDGKNIIIKLSGAEEGGK